MLENNNKNNPFRVPENYFDNFHKEMMNKIESTGEKAKIVPLWKKVLPWSAIAAAVCGIIFSVNIFMNSTESSDLLSSSTDKVQKGSDSYNLSEEDYFMMYLEDEANYDSYNDVIYTQLTR